jgi:hypothetical protein
MIEIYFYLGKRFNERLEEIGKRRKKSEKSEKEKIYDEILEIDKDNKNKRRALVERIRVSKKIHEIFTVVGMEKLKRTECSIHMIARCDKRDVKEILKYFKNKLNQNEVI